MFADLIMDEIDDAFEDKVNVFLNNEDGKKLLQRTTAY